MSKTINEIYNLRTSFSIIGLTGRKGAGVSKTANILSQKFIDNKFTKPKYTGKISNNDRKYRISYEFSEKNWKEYEIIHYKNVLFLFLLKQNFNELIQFLKDENFKFQKESYNIKKIFSDFSELSNKFIEIGDIDRGLKKRKKLKKLSKLFFGEEFKSYVKNMDSLLKVNYPIDRIKFFQVISNNLRKSGKPYNKEDNSNVHIYTIAEAINRIIKGYKYNEENLETHIAINSLRNSLEIMFFKERYSAFYMFAANSDKRRDFLEDKLEESLSDKKSIVSELLKIDEEEYFGKIKKDEEVIKSVDRGNFYIQDVQNCIQKSDIYLSLNPPLSKGQNKNAFESYKFESYKKESLKSIKTQLLQYTSLILHPGLITPSPQERCMQIAFNAKSNSGCISRQVGATITDEDFSIKSIGWNDVPKNSVPCLLKSTKNLVNGKDLNAYSEYEKVKDESISKFHSTITKIYKNLDYKKCEGLNHSYCFKDVQNIIDCKENQVHTRSLHAEENAMMQIAKYGGQPLNNGILFTTASPCELCSKKARQLEIKEIYYIDPYPGIAKWHILKDTDIDKRPKLILFAGAVGRAYNRLYEPLMSYKDELGLITEENPKNDKSCKEWNKESL